MRSKVRSIFSFFVLPVRLLTDTFVDASRAARFDREPLVVGETLGLRQQGAQGAAVDDWLAVEAKEAGSSGLRPER